MLPGILLSYLAGGFVSGGWGIFTIVVFAGAAKALGLHKNMSLARLPLHRGFSFVRTALATGLVFMMTAAAALWLVEQLALEDMAARATAFLIFLVLSVWPMSRFWPAPALPVVIDADEGSRDFLTKLWVGPGIPTAFKLTGQSHRRRKDAVIILLIYLNISLYVILIPSGSYTLPPGTALAMCFGLMPLTVYVWVRTSHSLFQAEKASTSRTDRLGRTEATVRQRFRTRDLFQGGGEADVPSGSPARTFDSSMPIEAIKPGMVVHALRDHRSSSGGPRGRWIIRDSHDSGHAGVMAALGEGTRTPCLVLRVLDAELGRRPSRMQELDVWEAGEGDRLVLLNVPMPHAHSCFYVVAVAARPDADDPDPGREAFASACGSALLVEIIAMVSSESGSPAYIRYENGLLTGYRKTADN